MRTDKTRDAGMKTEAQGNRMIDDMMTVQKYGF